MLQGSIDSRIQMIRPVYTYSMLALTSCWEVDRRHLKAALMNRNPLKRCVALWNGSANYFWKLEWNK